MKNKVEIKAGGVMFTEGTGLVVKGDNVEVKNFTIIGKSLNRKFIAVKIKGQKPEILTRPLLPLILNYIKFSIVKLLYWKEFKKYT